MADKNRKEKRNLEQRVATIENKISLMVQILHNLCSNSYNYNDRLKEPFAKLVGDSPQEKASDSK